MAGFIRWGVPFAAVLLAVSVARAEDLTVSMAMTTPTGVGEKIGDIVIRQSASGAMFVLNLKDLAPGPHGFHVHDNPDCNPTTVKETVVAGGAAGGHWDSDHTGKHAGPAGAGHIGDLPVLIAQADGTAVQSLVAPRIRDISVLKGHALMLHKNGDNYSDEPAPLGGGGPRFACGVIQ